MSWYLQELRRHESAYAGLMQLHDSVDKLNREIDIFNQMFERAHWERSNLQLVLDQSKRVRRASTLVVRALAEERENRNATA